MGRRAVVAVSVVALVVIAGCSQGPNSRAALIERVKMLEEKIARIEDDRLILDLRTVFPEQEPLLIKILAAALH